MILGLMSGERAGRLLCDYFFAIVTGDEDDLQDWLAGYWPAIMRVPHARGDKCARPVR